MPSPRAPSAKLLARRGAQVVMNKAALDAAQLGIADGAEELGRAILADAKAHAPDAPPYGQGLIESGVTAVWALGKLVAGDTSKAASKNKPRGMKVPKDQIVMFVGFEAPHAHLLELGTINMPAQPFLTPSFNRHISGAERFVVPAMGKRIKAVP